MANKPIFLIVMLSALISSMVTATLLSTYSMDIENAVYGSTIPQQGEESTGEESTGEESTGEESTGEESTGEESTGEESTGEESTGEESTGEVQNNSSIIDNSLGENEVPQVNNNSTLTAVGCTPGYGYDKNSPNPICVPLDGSEKPEGVITCSALGCPYNPPNPNTGQPIGNSNSITK